MCFQVMAFLLCHVLVNTSNFPTILPTNAPNLRKTSRYILKHINTRRPLNPLQHKGSRGLTWHEWVRHKRIHGFLVRMRSAVRIRPAAPKSIESFGFRCFFVEKMHFQVWVKMWSIRRRLRAVVLLSPGLPRMFLMMRLPVSEL